MIAVLKGIIGRGINGVAEMRITTDDEIDLTQSIVRFKGEITGMDSYFSGHQLSGERMFTVKTDNIVCLVD